jgi:hypothetical protein
MRIAIPAGRLHANEFLQTVDKKCNGYQMIFIVIVATHINGESS